MPDNIVTNVIQFPKKKPAIFSEKQRERLVTSIKDLSSQPEAAVDRIENDLSAQLIEKVREGATIVGEKLAEKVIKLFFK